MGLGFSVGLRCPSFRLYLHTRCKQKGYKAVYNALRWNVDGIERSRYYFHFHSDGVASAISGTIPSQLVQAFNALTDIQLFKQLSGYWLRRNTAGLIDQTNVTLSWHPIAGQLAGIKAVFNTLQIRSADLQFLADIPLRHVAFKPIDGAPEVTFYISGAVPHSWPQNETALQQLVIDSAISTARQTEGFFAKLLLPESEPAGYSPVDSYDVDTWQRILGPGMHYHMGLFEGTGPFDDGDMEAAMIKAVKTLYPHLPRGGSVYDIGCGWGGPMSMISRDLDIQVLGLTKSRQQFEYITALGFDVRLGNAEHLLPPGNFDAVLMLESLCRITDKKSLLKTLSFFTKKLIIRMNCQDNGVPGEAFDNTRYMISSAELRNLLTETGWTIQHWQNIRMQTLPSIKFWNERVSSILFYRDPHIDMLKTWSARVLSYADEWGRNNPLIEVVAIRY